MVVAPEVNQITMMCWTNLMCGSGGLISLCSFIRTTNLPCSDPRDTALGATQNGVTINYFRIACSFYGFEIRPARPEMWGNFLVRRICISIAITFWPATSCSVVLTPQKWTRMRNYVAPQNHAKQHLVSTILSMTVKPSILDWIHDSLESWSLARGVWPSNDGDYIYQEEALHLFFDLPERAGAGFSTLKLF